MDSIHYPGRYGSILVLVLHKIFNSYSLGSNGSELYPRTRGDIGFIMEVDGTRIYFSGGTEATEEMKALENIDTALISMSGPSTMGIEGLADAVALFEPRVVTPYQYRTDDGFSDLNKFERMLNERNPSIQFERMDWY